MEPLPQNLPKQSIVSLIWKRTIGADGNRDERIERWKYIIDRLQASVLIRLMEMIDYKNKDFSEPLARRLRSTAIIEYMTPKDLKKFEAFAVKMYGAEAHRWSEFNESSRLKKMREQDRQKAANKPLSSYKVSKRSRAVP